MCVAKAFFLGMLSQATRHLADHFGLLLRIVSRALRLIENEQSIVMSKRRDLNFVGRRVPAFCKAFLAASLANVATPYRACDHRRRRLAALALAPNLEPTSLWSSNKSQDWSGEGQTDGKHEARIAVARHRNLLLPLLQGPANAVL